MGEEPSESAGDRLSGFVWVVRISRPLHEMTGITT